MRPDGRPNGRLFLNLTAHWWNDIHAGVKTVEYRRLCPYWHRRICNAVFGRTFHEPPVPMADFRKGVTPHYLTVTFRRGYSRNWPDLTRTVTRIDIGPCPYDGWRGDYFRIYFTKEENTHEN